MNAERDYFEILTRESYITWTISNKEQEYFVWKSENANSSCQRIQKRAWATFVKAVIESLARKPERNKSWEQRKKKKSSRGHGEVEEPRVHAYSLADVVNFYIKKHNSLFTVSSAFNCVTRACITGSVSAHSVSLSASVSPAKRRKRRGLVSGASPL